MIGIAKRNLHHNRRLENRLEKGRPLNGQGLGAVSEFRYGAGYMKSNGCGCIAVYNSLIHLNKPQPLCEIVYFMERYRILFGILGCNPYLLGKALSRYGAAFERTEGIETEGAYIISFWTGKPFLSSAHTIFCRVCDSETIAYNRYNNRNSEVHYGSMTELLENKKLITAYRLLA
ncbi:MAG: hypothetical protein E7497_02940 [Ruminococcus sp.]|nr:hypothetical protein [Ruminococcus sp.]